MSRIQSTAHLEKELEKLFVIASKINFGLMLVRGQEHEGKERAKFHLNEADRRINQGRLDTLISHEESFALIQEIQSHLERAYEALWPESQGG